MTFANAIGDPELNRNLNDPLTAAQIVDVGAAPPLLRNPVKPTRAEHHDASDPPREADDDDPIEAQLAQLVAESGQAPPGER